MGIQLPSEVHGLAAGVLLYSFAALICSALVVWLTWTHHERTSYVALTGYLLLASTATCVASQLHVVAGWEDVAMIQWKAAVTDPNNPEQVISNGAVGADLGLWYFRQYAFSAAAMLVCFWAFALLQSIYGLKDRARLKPILKKVNDAGKGVSITLPIITICLLQVKTVQESTVGFIFLANIILMISLAGGCGLMLAILVQYIRTRQKLGAFNVDYGRSGSHAASIPFSQDRKRTAPRGGIYDRWLMTRFSVAFVVLSIFEVTNMLFQFTGMNNTNKDSQRDSPDTSIGRAKETMVLFLPGPAPSFLLFIVFGTTAPFRKHMRKTFLPKRWQKQPDAAVHPQGSQHSRKESTAASPATHSIYAVPSLPDPRRGIPLQQLEKARARAIDRDRVSSSDDESPMLGITRPKPSYHGQSHDHRGQYTV